MSMLPAILVLRAVPMSWKVKLSWKHTRTGKVYVMSFKLPTFFAAKDAQRACSVGRRMVFTERRPFRDAVEPRIISLAVLFPLPYLSAELCRRVSFFACNCQFS
jgi:hypothetical protein